VRSRAIAQATLWATVEAPTPPADRLGLRHREQRADRPHHIDGGDRRDHILADTAADQLAIERDIVHPADHDHPGAGVAHAGQLVEAGENVAAAVGLENDHIRRRRVAVSFDRRGHAAHLDLQVGLAEPAIFTGRLHRGGGLDGVAERLHRNARCRRDVLVVGDRFCGRRLCVLIFTRVADHFPTSLSLPLSASG
jgi:hypothetical protein